VFPSITTCIYSKKIQEATASTTENGWLRQFEFKQFRNHCDHCTSQSLRNCIPSKSTPEQQVAQPMQKLAVSAPPYQLSSGARLARHAFVRETLHSPCLQSHFMLFHAIPYHPVSGVSGVSSSQFAASVRPSQLISTCLFLATFRTSALLGSSLDTQTDHKTWQTISKHQHGHFMSLPETLPCRHLLWHPPEG
jgi:hypothetical protein